MIFILIHGIKERKRADSHLEHTPGNHPNVPPSSRSPYPNKATKQARSAILHDQQASDAQSVPQTQTFPDVSVSRRLATAQRETPDRVRSETPDYSLYFGNPSFGSSGDGGIFWELLSQDEHESDLEGLSGEKFEFGGKSEFTSWAYDVAEVERLCWAAWIHNRQSVRSPSKDAEGRATWRTYPDTHDPVVGAAVEAIESGDDLSQEHKVLLTPFPHSTAQLGRSALHG